MSDAPQGTADFRKALESLTHDDMPGGNLWETTTVREKSLMLKAWRAAIAAAPQQAQDQRCNEVFEALGLDQDRYITEGGAINIPRLRATIKHPSEYLPPDHWMNSPR